MTVLQTGIGPVLVKSQYDTGAPDVVKDLDVIRGREYRGIGELDRFVRFFEILDFELLLIGDVKVVPVGETLFSDEGHQRQFVTRDGPVLVEIRYLVNHEKVQSLVSRRHRRCQGVLLDLTEFGFGKGEPRLGPVNVFRLLVLVKIGQDSLQLKRRWHPFTNGRHYNRWKKGGGRFSLNVAYRIASAPNLCLQQLLVSKRSKARAPEAKTQWTLGEGGIIGV